MTVPHHVRPDHHPLPTGTRLDGLGHDGASLNRKPRSSTAPPGLFAPAPEVVVAKVAKPKRTRTAAAKPAPQPRKVAPCGTETAAKRHKSRGEVDATGQLLCQECAAGRIARRTKAPRIATMTLEPGARCGTRQGYDDHLVRGETTCQPCRDATAAAARGRYTRRTEDTAKAPKLPPTVGPKCGTEAGRSWHRRRHQEPCTPCKTAVNRAARKTFNGEAA